MSKEQAAQLAALVAGGGGSTKSFLYVIQPGDGNEITISLPFTPPTFPYGAWAESEDVSDFITYYIPGSTRFFNSLVVITQGSLNPGDVIEIFVCPRAV